MFGKVKIGTSEIEMLANAATPYRFKQVFRMDYLKAINAEDSDGFDKVDLFVKMGFIMASQAAGADMAKLTEESFYEWLSAFEPMDVNMSVDKIATLFNGNAEQTATPKEPAAE